MNKLPILFLAGCVVIAGPVFLCGCESGMANTDSKIEAYYKQAEAHHKAGRYEDSLAELKKVIAIKPDSPDCAPLYYFLGAVYQKHKQYTNAIATYKKAIALEPTGEQADFLRKRISEIENRDKP